MAAVEEEERTEAEGLYPTEDGETEEVVPELTPAEKREEEERELRKRQRKSDIAFERIRARRVLAKKQRAKFQDHRVKVYIDDLDIMLQSGINRESLDSNDHFSITRFLSSTTTTHMWAVMTSLFNENVIFDTYTTLFASFHGRMRNNKMYVFHRHCIKDPVDDYLECILNFNAAHRKVLYKFVSKYLDAMFCTECHHCIVNDWTYDVFEPPKNIEFDTQYAIVDPYLTNHEAIVMYYREPESSE
jgi:hypothetical protein